MGDDWLNNGLALYRWRSIIEAYHDSVYRRIYVA